ncbi:MAG: chromosomal replication initiator protein DnaA [Clostridia bacterium]|nr:chromosomal replication initiator protein DnaA [Clostridia bacterium]
MQNYLDKQWADVMLDLEDTISAVGLDLWVRKIKPINIDDDTLIFIAPNEMVRDTIIRGYTKQISEAMMKNFKLCKFDFILDKDKDAYISSHHLLDHNGGDELPRAITNEEIPENPFNPRYTFSNFVVGTTNRVIYAATRAVAENPGTRFNPLFIYGGVGLGKTHLLHAIGNYIWEANKGNIKIVYVSSETFANDLIDILRSGRDKGTVEFRKKYRFADVLLVDDIQFISNKKAVQEEFFHTFNDLYQAGKQIIIASDRPPKEIQELEERLSSRFASGLVQDIQKPDFETRVMIINKKIELEGYSFDNSLIPTLAEKLEKFNIREIEGVLNKLDLFAKLHGKFVVDEEVVSEVLSKSHELEVSVGRVVTQDKIIEAICSKFNIRKDELFGKKRTKELVEPRQICIYLMWKKLNIPLTAISKLFNRDHTTAIHARDKVIEMMKEDMSVKKMIEELEDLIVH